MNEILQYARINFEGSLQILSQRNLLKIGDLILLIYSEVDIVI